MPSEKKTEDSEVCGLQYGEKTAATSMVAHLVQKHEISVPEYLTEKASQHSSEKQLSVKNMFAQISASRLLLVDANVTRRVTKLIDAARDVTRKKTLLLV